MSMYLDIVAFAVLRDSFQVGKTVQQRSSSRRNFLLQQHLQLRHLYMAFTTRLQRALNGWILAPSGAVRKSHYCDAWGKVGEWECSEGLPGTSVEPTVVRWGHDIVSFDCLTFFLGNVNQSPAKASRKRLQTVMKYMQEVMQMMMVKEAKRARKYYYYLKNSYKQTRHTKWHRTDTQKDGYRHIQRHAKWLPNYNTQHKKMCCV